MPSENSGEFQEILDFGATIPASRIQVDMSVIETIGEGVTISPQISHRYKWYKFYRFRSMVHQMF